MTNEATQLNTWKNLPVQSSEAAKFFLNKLRELQALQAKYSEQGSRLLKYQLATAILFVLLVLTLVLTTLNLIF